MYIINAMAFSTGRMYIVRFADNFAGTPKDSDTPNFLFASGLYEGDIEKDEINWVTLSNWFSPSDMEHDVREVAYVIRDSIVEYWDVTPTKPGINLKEEENAVNDLMDEIDEEEAGTTTNHPNPIDNGRMPYHG
jgi:hypothetical protein